MTLVQWRDTWLHCSMGKNENLQETGRCVRVCMHACVCSAIHIVKYYIYYIYTYTHWSQEEECGLERDDTGPCSDLMSSTILMKMTGGVSVM